MLVNDLGLDRALDRELAGVIVCALQEWPEVQSACLERGIPCLDVTGEQEFLVLRGVE